MAVASASAGCEACPSHRLVRRREGCEENQATFHSRFDHIILLSAPVETLLERLATRTSNSYGKSTEDLRRFLDDVENVEPVLRRVADHEVQTTDPLNLVVTRILRIIGE